MPITVRRASSSTPARTRPSCAAPPPSSGPDAQPLVCTEGQPSTAFHRLAAAIRRTGGELSYHGDFDWPGIAIATGIITRHNARPWRFTAADYETAIKNNADYVGLAGTPQPTPWAPSLAAAMTAHGRAVYEESVADRLIADLATDAAGGG